jgi:acetolactate synthase-1/2/3 large subunit
MGAKLARSQSTVCATVGDGAYIFSNPTASHFVATAYKIPILTVIYNNESWGAVRSAIQETYPEGLCVKSGNFIGSELKPSPRFELVAEAHGAYALAVTEPRQLLDALKACIDEVNEHKRSALLNVKCLIA